MEIRARLSEIKDKDLILWVKSLPVNERSRILRETLRKALFSKVIVEQDFVDVDIFSKKYQFNVDTSQEKSLTEEDDFKVDSLLSNFTNLF